MPTWLKNAKIDEVSLVPKGANRRRFTVFKAQPTGGPVSDLSKASKLGSLIQRLREAKGLSAAELGQAAGVTGGTMRAIETGEIMVPPQTRLTRIARALGVPVSRLVSAVPSGDRDRIDRSPPPNATKALRSGDMDDIMEAVLELDDEQKAKVRKALEMEPEDVFEKLTKATDEQKVALAKALGIEKVDDDSLVEKVLKKLGLKATDQDPDPNVPEAVRLAIESVKGEVAKADKRAADAEIRLKKAEDLIAKRDKEARVQQMVVKAAKYGKMGSADDISKLLSDTHEKLGDDGLKTVEAMLAKGEEAFEQAQTFAEIGVVPRGEMHDNALAEIDAKAAEIMKADSSVKTIEEARGRAWKENPTLYKRYQAERRQQLKNADEED